MVKGPVKGGGKTRSQKEGAEKLNAATVKGCETAETNASSSAVHGIAGS